jgi:hypothetical protein
MGCTAKPSIAGAVQVCSPEEQIENLSPAPVASRRAKLAEILGQQGGNLLPILAKNRVHELLFQFEQESAQISLRFEI